MGTPHKPHKRQFISRPLRPDPVLFYARRPKDESALFTVYGDGEQIFIRLYEKGDEQHDDYFFRKSDKYGRITLPADLKQGALKTSPLEVTIVDDNTYILAPAKYKACILCKCSEQDHLLVKVADQLICLSCLKQLSTAAEESNLQSGILHY